MQQFQGELADALAFEPLAMDVGSDLVDLVDPSQGGKLWGRMSLVRRHLARELGVVVPPVKLGDDARLKPDGYLIRVREAPVARARVKPGHVLALGPEKTLKKLCKDIVAEPTYGRPAVWLEEGRVAEAEALECLVFDVVSVLATHLTDVVRRHAGSLLGLDEVRELLGLLNRPTLVNEVVGPRVGLVTLRTILRNLLDERVPIRDLALILETLADHAAPERSASDLTELVRQALGPIICRDYVNADGEICAVIIEPEQEDQLPAQVAKRRGELKKLADRGLQPLVVTSAALRPWVRSLLDGDTVVLSRAEVLDGYTVRAIK